MQTKRAVKRKASETRASDAKYMNIFHLLRTVEQTVYWTLHIHQPHIGEAGKLTRGKGLNLLVAAHLLDIDSLGHLVTTNDGLLGVGLA